MLYFKACPRCRGDLHMASDMWGAYKECLHCGYIEDLYQEGLHKAGQDIVEKASAGESRGKAA